MAANCCLCEHERQHLGMQRAIVQRQHPIDPDADQSAAVLVKNRRAERAAAVVLDIAARQLNRQRHARVVVVVMAVKVDLLLDPVRQTDGQFSIHRYASSMSPSYNTALQSKRNRLLFDKTAKQ